MTAAKPWFEEWFDHDYLLVYGHRDARDARAGVDLLARTVRPAPGTRALDLACGPGRHAVELARLGLDVVGLDLSETLLDARTREPLPDPDPQTGTRPGAVRYVRADMRALPFASASFGLVASFFTSFGYFDDAGNATVLAEVARVLAPGGAFVLDYVNRAELLASLVPETRKSRGSTFILESRAFDPPGERLVKRIEIQDGSRTRTRTESVRIYDVSELEALLARAGLETVTLLGDLHGAAFDRERSPRLIVHARRA